MIESKYDKYQIMLRKQQLANRLRDNWKLIDGGATEEAAQVV